MIAHRWCYGATQQFCMACKVGVTFCISEPYNAQMDFNANAMLRIYDEEGCSVSESDWQKMVENLRKKFVKTLDNTPAAC